MELYRLLTLTLILVLHAVNQNMAGEEVPPGPPMAGGPYTAIDELSLTDDQQKQFGLFKKLVMPLIKADFMKTDIFLVKVFRTAGFDRVKAKDYLIETLKFRQDWKLDDPTVPEEWQSFQLEYEIDINLNHDREGRPIFLIYAGKWDLSKVAMSGKLDSLRRYSYNKFDEISNLTVAKVDKGVSRYFFIGDLYGFNLVKGGCIPCIEYWTDVSINADKHWPKMIFKLVYLNSEGGLYSQTLNTVKPMISEETRGNIAVYDTDATKWKEALKPYIKDSQIPKGLHQVEGGAGSSGASSPGVAQLNSAAGQPGVAQLSSLGING